MNKRNKSKGANKMTSSELIKWKCNNCGSAFYEHTLWPVSRLDANAIRAGGDATCSACGEGEYKEEPVEAGDQKKQAAIETAARKKQATDEADKRTKQPAFIFLDE